MGTIHAMHDNHCHKKGIPCQLRGNQQAFAPNTHGATASPQWQGITHGNHSCLLCYVPSNPPRAEVSVQPIYGGIVQVGLEGGVHIGTYRYRGGIPP